MELEVIDDDVDFEPVRFTIAYKDNKGYMDYAFFYAQDHVHAEEKFTTRYPDYKVLEIYH